MDIVEFNYISPTSTYDFNNKINNYYLVHVSSHNRINAIIHKILLPDLKNIDNVSRAFAINKAVTTANNFEYPTQSLSLFERNVSTNRLTLLFSEKINLMDMDFRELQTITLKQPSKVAKKYRSIKYTDDSSFLAEQFFNYESSETKTEKCIIFLTKFKQLRKSITLVNPYIYSLNKEHNKSSKAIYNRYHSNIIKEMPVVAISGLCSSNRMSDYLKMIQIYNIDVNRYVANRNAKTFRSLVLRKMNNNFRPLKINPYINNLVSCPADGRVSAFHINSNLKFKLGNVPYSLDAIIRKPYKLNEGSGFIVRMTPADYQRVSMPYSGYLTEASIFHSLNTPYYICLKFESTYFMPTDVHEREYISVLYGNNIQMSRAHPDLVEKQPKIKLIFYVIMIGNSSTDSVVFMNRKLLQMKNNIELNSTIKINKKLWLEQGEEVAGFNCTTSSNVLFISNRLMDFTSDIKYYSKLEDTQDSQDIQLEKKVESYIKTNDIVGILL
jgi:hypothetical protein